MPKKKLFNQNCKLIELTENLQNWIEIECCLKILNFGCGIALYGVANTVFTLFHSSIWKHYFCRYIENEKHSTDHTIFDFRFLPKIAITKLACTKLEILDLSKIRKFLTIKSNNKIYEQIQNLVVGTHYIVHTKDYLTNAWNFCLN